MQVASVDGMMRQPTRPLRGRWHIPGSHAHARWRWSCATSPSSQPAASAGHQLCAPLRTWSADILHDRCAFDCVVVCFATGCMDYDET